MAAVLSGFQLHWLGAALCAAAVCRLFPISKQFLRFGSDGNFHCSSAAIQRAIDETSAHGGGTVVIPSGVYDVGAITLKSNVNLHLESKDTILRFTRDITPANYPLVFAHYEGSKLYNWSPLIYAYQQENIALTGKGTLDGQADKNNWWNWSRTVNPDGTITKPGNKDVKLLRKMTDNGTPAEERIFGE